MNINAYFFYTTHTTTHSSNNMKYNIGVIGSGGREHAICHSISISPQLSNLYCFPGNAGTAQIATNVNIHITDSHNFEYLKQYCKKHEIHILIVGPEQPLVNGIVDFFTDTNIMVFGPNQIAAQLEGSKLFTKTLCKQHNIPTANYLTCTVKNIHSCISQITTFPIVIKIDGLASGKGVYICHSLQESQTVAQQIIDNSSTISISDSKILIEDYLAGEEMSFFIISDGNTYQSFFTAQDHKREFEGDRGSNTGGMGCYSPSRLITPELHNNICSQIIEPTLHALSTDHHTKYIGFLYAGLMIQNGNSPYLIEYNVRMGDPECQTILPLLQTDLLQLISNCCTQQLYRTQISFSDKRSLCIVLCSKGYPHSYDTLIDIPNLDKLSLKTHQCIFHAGTTLVNNPNNNHNIIVQSNGGRVLNFVSITDNFGKSRKEILELLSTLNWENGYYRRDIGYMVIP